MMKVISETFVCDMACGVDAGEDEPLPSDWWQHPRDGDYQVCPDCYEKPAVKRALDKVEKEGT